jgi:hypothetical protein
MRSGGDPPFHDYIHPDETGHLVAALGILRALAESGAIPEDRVRLDVAANLPGAEGRLARRVLSGD